MIDKTEIFNKKPTDLPPGVYIYRVDSGTAIVPVYFNASGQFWAAKPTTTQRDWFVKKDEIFQTVNMTFQCADALQFHNRPLSERWGKLHECYSIDTNSQISDSWGLRTFVGFILFAIDLRVYR